MKDVIGEVDAWMARGDAVICNSQYTARIVRERHPEASDRVGVIYRGLDEARFDPNTKIVKSASVLGQYCAPSLSQSLKGSGQEHDVDQHCENAQL